MDRALRGGAELEYETHGFADFFTPLLRESVLTSRHRLVFYNRVGCRGSSRIAGPVSLTQQAAHAVLAVHA